MSSEKQKKESLSARVFEAIERDSIKPKPKWHFLLKEWIILATAIVAFVLGVIATTLTIYITSVNHLMERVISISDFSFWLEVVPLVWIILLIVGVFYTVYALHVSKKGYKWHLSWLVLASLLGSILFGASTYAMGAGELIDEYLLQKVPLYKKVTKFDPGHWMNIEQGVVVGLLTKIDKDACIVVRLDTHTPLTVRFDERTVIHTPNKKLQIFVPVKVIGELVSEDEFRAYEIRQFTGRGGGIMRARIPNRQEGEGEVKKENGASVIRSVEQDNDGIKRLRVKNAF